MSYLDAILDHKRREVAERKAATPLHALMSRPSYAQPVRSLEKALRADPPAVIAELKKASPSKKIIRADFDPVSLALGMARGGAHALSVLTDERFFQGSLGYLAAIREQVSLPLLRKDFIIDEFQIHEARAYGADAVLLIAAALGHTLLRTLKLAADAVGLEVLVEVHDEAEMRMLYGSGIRLVGINNRNLHTFGTDLEVTLRLRPLAPGGSLVVSESGIRTAEDVRRLAEEGIDAVLVGETFMRAPDPGEAVRAMVEGTRGGRR